jgi:hypothetical protein
LKDQNPSPIFVSVDLELDDNRDIPKKFPTNDIPGAGYIKAYLDSYHIMKVSNDLWKIQSFLEKRLPVLRRFDEIEDLDRAIETDYHMTGVCFGIFTSEERIEFKEFRNTAYDWNDVHVFAYAIDKGEFGAKFGLERDNSIVLVKPPTLTGVKEKPFTVMYGTVTAKKIVDMIHHE